MKISATKFIAMFVMPMAIGLAAAIAVKIVLHSLHPNYYSVNHADKLQLAKYLVFGYLLVCAPVTMYGMWLVNLAFAGYIDERRFLHRDPVIRERIRELMVIEISSANPIQPTDGSTHED